MPGKRGAGSEMPGRGGRQAGGARAEQAQRLRDVAPWAYARSTSTVGVCPQHQTRRADQGRAAHHESRCGSRPRRIRAAWGRVAVHRRGRGYSSWARHGGRTCVRVCVASSGHPNGYFSRLLPRTGACGLAAVNGRGLATGFSWNSGNVPRPTLPPRREFSSATCRVCVGLPRLFAVPPTPCRGGSAAVAVSCRPPACRE